MRHDLLNRERVLLMPVGELAKPVTLMFWGSFLRASLLKARIIVTA